MNVIERAIEVRFRHRIIFTDGVFDPKNPVLRETLLDGAIRKPPRALVVVDETLARARPGLVGEIRAYFGEPPGLLDLVAEPMVVEGGERVKNAYGHVTEVHAAIERHHIDRHSYLVGVGGGAVLDMAGFAAATAHRGVRHVRIPTTTLSQDDSGVGVKNGVNAFGKKNFIGAFAPPFAVINDFLLLSSLPPRDLRAGFVEAVKVALIRDPGFFAAIEADAAALAAFEPGPMRALIRRCAELHTHHIATSGDPFELGSARPLDFGHWAAHKLEQLSEYRMRHGEAVAIGIALDTTYSRRLGFLDAGAAERVLVLLERLGFDLFSDLLLPTGEKGLPRVLEGLEEFREHLGGELTVTLLRDIGAGFETHQMDIAEVVASIHELRARSGVMRGRALSAAGSRGS